MMAAKGSVKERRLRFTQEDIDLLWRALAYYAVHGVKVNFEKSRYSDRELISGTGKGELRKIAKLIYRLTRHHVGRVCHSPVWLYYRSQYESYIQELKRILKV